MKTSNKLLIAFAAALILIPVLGMLIVSATQYKTGTHSMADVVHKVENFSTPTKNMASIAVSTPFKLVNIADGKGKVLNIELIKDEKFGVKVPTMYKDFITLSVDVNGQLQIIFKDQPKSDDGRRKNYYATIYVYAPKVSSLTVANANNLAVKTSADTLNLNLSKVESFYFNNGTQLKHLNVNAQQIKELILRRDDIKSAKIAVTDTKFAIESMSLDDVNITTNGNSKVEIYKTSDIKTDQIIKRLVLNTNGIADVKIENTIIDNCSGKFSDETIVQMPAINLNQMYKK